MFSGINWLIAVLVVVAAKIHCITMATLCRYVLEIAVHTYLGTRKIEHVLLCSRTGSLHRCKQSEEIPVYQEFYSRLHNCCKLI